MAAVSAWAKPGAWALDSEEHESMEQQRQKDSGYSSSDSKTSSYFPSLAAAATSKTSKKKKSHTLSLAEFTTGQSVTHGAARFHPSARSSAAPDEPLVLPTGPRERTADELERSSRGFGYSSYGGGAGGRGRISGDGDSGSRWGSSRVSDEPRRGGPGGGFDGDSGPSRADEVDDWGATKRSVPPPSERRERGGGGLFDSHSRADESDSWISKKSVAPPSDGRRINGGGFDGPRERRGGFEMFNRDGSDGGGVDSDTWGKKREESSGGGSVGRPRLVLQHRSLPLANGNNGEQNRGEQQGFVVRSKGSNPFGEARPREEVLSEKGQDWKKIDEKLESVKIQEAPPEGAAFGKKGFGMGNGTGSLPEDRIDRTWKKADAAVVPLPRSGF